MRHQFYLTISTSLTENKLPDIFPSLGVASGKCEFTTLSI